MNKTSTQTTFNRIVFLLTLQGLTLLASLGANAQFVPTHDGWQWMQPQSFGGSFRDVSVHSTDGRLQLQETVNGSADVSSLSTGIYILELQTENNVLRQRFIKN